MEEQAKQHRNLKLLVPFLEAQGYTVQYGVDHIKIFSRAPKVELKINGAEVLQKVSKEIKDLVTQSVAVAIEKYAKLKEKENQNA